MNKKKADYLLQAVLLLDDAFAALEKVRHLVEAANVEIPDYREDFSYALDNVSNTRGDVEAAFFREHFKKEGK